MTESGASLHKVPPLPFLGQTFIPWEDIYSEHVGSDSALSVTCPGHRPDTD